MFINFTNHSSELWSIEQREEAEKYGDITDISFPAVDPAYGSDKIIELAGEYAEKICGYKPKAVLVQGEMSLCFSVVSLLMDSGIKVLCATTERVVTSRIGQSGETVKISEFRFVRFREYVSL